MLQDKSPIKNVDGGENRHPHFLCDRHFCSGITSLGNEGIENVEELRVMPRGYLP